MSILNQKINAFIARLAREDVNMHAFQLSINGRMLAKAYYGPFREGEPHRMYSVSKTMTGLAIGMLCEDGKLSLDQRITEFFPDWLPDAPSPFLTSLTIRDMLRMATCYRQTAYQERTDENWAKSFFTGRPDHAPGTVFNYDTGCSQVLAALVRRLSWQEVIDFLQDRLFAPLGADDPKKWLRDPSGCCQGGTGLCMSLRDLHKVSQCLLDGGRGLVPAWYVREMQLKQIDTVLQGNQEERYGYGWQCWRTRSGWSMYGMGGQLVIFCPEQRAILSTLADTRLDPCGVQRIYNAFYDELEPALAAIAAEMGVGKSADAYLSLHLPIAGLPDASGPHPERLGPYTFAAENDLGMKTLQLSQSRLIWENARGRAELPFSPGNVIEAEYPSWPDEPALVASGWLDDRNLRVRCHAIGDAPCGFDMLLSFGADTVTLQSTRSWDPRTDDYDGAASGKI